MNSRTVHYDTFQYYSNGIMPWYQWVYY